MTAQIPDYLVYRGRKRALHSNPLEQYWHELNPRPELPAASTACWRGYVATWLIEQERLFLTNIEIPFVGNAYGVATFFPKQAPPIAATWFSGELRLPDGEQLRYVHMGYSSTYAIDTLLEVWQGHIVIEEEYDNRQQQLIKRRVTNALEDIYGADEAGFLRAIYHEPADDAPRLIYADWLDERNDGRAELLRAYTKQRQPHDWSTVPSRADARGGRLWWRLLEYRTQP